MGRMSKENKIHLEGAKAYGPQDYEVVDELKKLKEENKKLKSDLAYERTMLDNVRAEYNSLQEENKKLKEERIFSLGEYDYMILTSTTPQLKVYRKENSGDVFTK